MEQIILCAETIKIPTEIGKKPPVAKFNRFTPVPYQRKEQEKKNLRK